MTAYPLRCTKRIEFMSPDIIVLSVLNRLASQPTEYPLMSARRAAFVAEIRDYNEGSDGRLRLTMLLLDVISENSQKQISNYSGKE